MIVVLSLSVLVPSVLLIWAGTLHLKDPQRFRAHVVAHDLVPFRHTQKAARAFSVTELLVGVGGLSAFPAVLAERDAWTVIAAGSVATVYAAIGVYVAFLVARGSNPDCGCFGRGEKASAFTVSRALSLGVAAIGAAVGTNAVGPGALIAGAGLLLAIASQVAIERRTHDPQRQ